MSKSRRAFIRGQWNPAYPEQNAGSVRQVEIVSLIVSTWPQHLDAVSAAILALGNTEIHGRDPKGKLIVVLEEPSQGAVGAKTTRDFRPAARSVRHHGLPGQRRCRESLEGPIP